MAVAAPGTDVKVPPPANGDGTDRPPTEMLPVAGSRFVGRTDSPAKVRRPTLFAVLALATVTDAEPLALLLTVVDARVSVVARPTAETVASPPWQNSNPTGGVSDIVPVAISPAACSVMTGPMSDVHDAVPPSVVPSSEMACPPVAAETSIPVIATTLPCVRDVATNATTARAIASVLLKGLKFGVVTVRWFHHSGWLPGA